MGAVWGIWCADRWLSYSGCTEQRNCAQTSNCVRAAVREQSSNVQGSCDRKQAMTAATSSPGSPTLLVAFDFDHTIVDGNTDTWVIRALPAGPDAALPARVKDSYQPGRWTEYMQRVLAHMHDAGCSVADMQRVLQTLPLTPGMPQLLGALAAWQRAGQHVSCVILSDSNAHFIDWALSGSGAQWSGLFSHVYTNASHVQAGRLHVRPCHTHSCPSCPVNMCKRELLRRHTASTGGGLAHRVVYVGDGSNDLCPAQALAPGDMLCVRRGFALDRLLQDAAVAASVHAQVMRWSSGVDILEALGSRCGIRGLMMCSQPGQ